MPTRLVLHLELRTVPATWSQPAGPIAADDARARGGYAALGFTETRGFER